MRKSTGSLCFILLLIGCSGISMQSGGGGLPNPDGSFPGGVRGQDSTSTALPNVRRSRQTICRSQGIPRGWVAVDYIADRNCGGSQREPYSAQVVQMLAPLPVGTVLTICRGQTTPVNWHRDERGNAENNGAQCPRNPGDQNTEPTTLNITRLR